MALLRRCGKSPELNQIQLGDITVDFGGYTASGPGGPIDLTPKEIDLLKLLVEHKGSGADAVADLGRTVGI